MSSKTRWDGIRIGDEVEHFEYGLGKVLAKEGSNDGAKALVEFTGGEFRELVLKFARLKIVKRALTRVEGDL